ncbi:MAG: ribosome recycling factor [Acidobacteria bacterium SCN 69-37]|nr:MAG: ribosome recycling factor [Acidobacteria bacterium SCN 69-37]
MDVTDLKSLSADVRKRMDAAVEHVRRDLAGLRSGRASVTLLDPVQVEAYGTLVPINQVATLSIPEPTVIMAQPFDPSLTSAIERAIQKSPLGLNPASDGKVIRIPVPSLTEERRKELSRLVHRYAEDGRNVVRQVRREVNDRVKKMTKDHEISEDAERRGLDEIQKITDQFIKAIDELQQKKDVELIGR